MKPAAALLCALAMTIAACGGSSGAESCDFGTDQIDTVVQTTADAMAALDSARFEMTRSGAEVEVQGMVFDSVVGQYGAPSSARALLAVHAAGLSIELGTISIDDRTWLTNPITGGWEALTSGTGFNPAVVFHPDTGWKPLLESLTETRYGTAPDDCNALVVVGALGADRISALTLGLVEPQVVSLELTIEPSNRVITRAVFSTIGDAGTSDWVIILSGFDDPVDIRPPV